MFHVKNHKQAHIFDPWGHLGPKQRKLLDRSWAGLFQQEILPSLPVEALRKHYHDFRGRPSKELHSMIGLMILQQMHDLTDREAVEQYCFNTQWHYALNITSPEDTASYISEKSLWTMRNILVSEGLQDIIFVTSMDRLATLFKADLENSVWIPFISSPTCDILAGSGCLPRPSGNSRSTSNDTTELFMTSSIKTWFSAI